MKRRVDKEKVIAYRRSKLFPWNFIFEDVDERAIEHFAPYAVQVLGDFRKIEKHDEQHRMHGRRGGRMIRSAERRGREAKYDVRMVEKDAVRKWIRDEVSAVVSDFLFETEDEDAIRMHGDFAHLFPFAFSQCIVQAILSGMHMRLEDVIDINAISDLMGVDVKEIRKREDFIRDLISKKRNLKMMGSNLLGKKVRSVNGDHIGDVSDIIFDSETGVMRGIRVTVKRHTPAIERMGRLKKGAMKSGRSEEVVEIPMSDVRFNSYNGGFVLREE